MKDDRIAALLAPVLAPYGLELEEVDVVPVGRRRTVRIVVDGDGPQGRGPLLDDIAEATRAISTSLDADAALGENPYTLEVSSRGVSRPLSLPRHWRRNRGRLVAVTLTSGEQLRGRVVDSDDDRVVLDTSGPKTPGPDRSGQLREVGYPEVTKAVVQVELNRPRGTDEAGQDEVGQDEVGQDEED